MEEMGYEFSFVGFLSCSRFIIYSILDRIELLSFVFRK